MTPSGFIVSSFSLKFITKKKTLGTPMPRQPCDWEMSAVSLPASKRCVGWGDLLAPTALRAVGRARSLPLRRPLGAGAPNSVQKRKGPGLLI